MRSRYDLAEDSETRSADDSFYKDICTIPMHKFRHTTAPEDYTVIITDTKRLDLMIYRLYGISELEDLVLWINKVADPTALSVADKLSIPSKSDIESFYYSSRE